MLTRKRIAEWMGNPGSLWIKSGVYVNDAAAFMMDDKQNIKVTKERRRYGKKVGGINEFAMVFEELFPIRNCALGCRASRHVVGYCRFVDSIAKFCQLAMDPWSTPIIFCSHLDDQRPELLADSRTTWFRFRL